MGITAVASSGSIAVAIMIPVDMFTNPSQEPSRSGFGGGASTAEWRDRLHRCLASNATPVVLFPESVRSAASLWSGLRSWTHTLRAAAIGPGHVVWCALPPGEALLQLLLACLWDGISVVVQPPAADLELLRRAVEDEQGVLLVLSSESALPASAPAWMLVPASGGWPSREAQFARRTDVAQSEGVEEPFVRLGNEQRLTHAQLLHTVVQQLGDATLHGARVLTLAHWFDAQSLGAGILAPLLCADELFVGDVDDTDGARRLLEEEPIGRLMIGRSDARRLQSLLESRTGIVVQLLGR